MHINREQVRCAKIISACVNARHMDTRHVFLIRHYWWHCILVTRIWLTMNFVDKKCIWKDTSNYAVNMKFHYCAWQTRQILIISRAAIRWSFADQSTTNTFQISKQFNQSFLRPFFKKIMVRVHHVIRKKSKIHFFFDKNWSL